MLNKDQLIFDPADIEESDRVGAYLQSSDGTLLTHTTQGTSEALDVNIAGSTGGLQIEDGDGDTLEVNPDGSINVNSTSNEPLKFRLDGAIAEVIEDTVTPTNNQPLPVKLTSASGDIQITAGDLNVQLEHTGANFDSVRIGDGTEIAGVTTNTELTVVDRANNGIATSSTTVTDASTVLVSSALNERKYIEIQNRSKKSVFIGGSGVTTGNGLVIPGRASWSCKVGDGVSLFAVTESGDSADVRILELA